MGRDRLARLTEIGIVRMPSTSRNSRTPAPASSTLACRLRQMPRAASKIAIAEVIGERAPSSTSVSASASASRVRMGTIAEASTNFGGHR